MRHSEENYEGDDGEFNEASEDDVYVEHGLRKAMDDNEIDSEEEGFMIGYNNIDAEDEED